MYYAHFGLDQAPFKITPNTEFFYSGGNRGPILEALMYAISHGEGIVKVTGEVGSGKTMLCNMMQTRMPAHIESVYLANPSVSPEEILHAIAFDLQLPVDRAASRLEVMHALQDHLVKRHAEGHRVVVFVEESQSMPLATLEEMRLLSNLETRNDKLLQIVLFGQPELDDNLRQPAIRQLRERITHSFRLEPLEPDEVREYLMFRLRAAGYRGPDMFSSLVVSQVARASEGLTRRINLLADKALLAAFSENTHNVRLKHIKAAIRDSEFSRESAVRPPPRYGWRAAALMLAGAVVGVALYAFVDRGRAPQSVAAAVTGGNQAAPVPAAAPGPDIAQQRAPVGAAAAPTDAQKSAEQETGGDTLEQRMAATQTWLANEPHATYSIQLLGAEGEPQLKNHLNVITKFVEMNKLFMYRTVAKGRPSVTLLYGSFGDRHAAEDALAKLPPSLKANRPILRTVQGIRAEIKQHENS
jgi:type II secretory pathway predicted ATPase ExeA